MSAEYNADQIQILEGLEAVRKRPGMYIGSTSSRGLHHLVYEIVDNAVDEALAGYCDTIDVQINADNSITVIDDGRGIPVDIQKKAGLPAVEVVFTILHAGGKFGGGGYKVSGGLHGVGASVVNALSEWLEVEVCHGGKVYKQRYERGKTMYPLKIVGDCPSDKHGTKVTFLPDKTIFEETVYDYDTLKIRLRETAFLTKNLKIILRDDREDKKEKVFHYEGGIKEFVTYLNRSNVPLYDNVIYCEGKKDNVLVEVAMQHNDSYTENIYSFVNNINTPEGGTHLTGFRNALTKTFNDYGRKNKLLKDSEPALTGEDIREGLTAIISVKIEEPQFEGQTKQKLGNSEARGAVDSVVSEQLTYFLEQNPSVAKTIIEKSVLAQRARAAARKARDLTRRKTVLDGDRPVVAAAVGGLQEEVEAVQKLVVHPLDGNVLGLAALGEVLFQVAQQPFVLVGRALRDAHAHLALPPLRVVGEACDEHHRVAGRVEVALLDLRRIGRIALGQQLGADVDDFDAEIVQSLVDLNGQLVRSHRALLVLVPRFGIAVALSVDLLPEPSGRNACEDGRQSVFLRSSFPHQEKNGKCLLSHDVEIFWLTKRPQERIITT